MAAVTAFQRRLQAHVDELRAVGRALSDRAWAIQRRIDEARAAGVGGEKEEKCGKDAE